MMKPFDPERIQRSKAHIHILDQNAKPCTVLCIHFVAFFRASVWWPSSLCIRVVSSEYMYTGQVIINSNLRWFNYAYVLLCTPIAHVVPPLSLIEIQTIQSYNTISYIQSVIILHVACQPYDSFLIKRDVYWSRINQGHNWLRNICMYGLSRYVRRRDSILADTCHCFPAIVG